MEEEKIREIPLERALSVGQKNKINNKFLFKIGNTSYLIRCTPTMKVVSMNPKCSICGAKATHAYLCKRDGSYYITFYTEINGKLVLFTKDHIIPRAQGGGNGLSNLQTCCEICNKAKGKEVCNNEEAARIVELTEINKRLKKELEIQQKANTKLKRNNELMKCKAQWMKKHFLYRLLEKKYYKRTEII